MNARPKLLYLVSEDWYFVSHRLALAKAAKAAGYDVLVVTRTAAHAEEIRDNGLKLIPMDFERAGLGPAFEMRSLKEIIQLYRVERPAIAHHVAMKPVIYGAIAARAAGTRCVVNALMGLGYVFSSETIKARLLRPGVRYALRHSLRGHATRVIVQNKDDADQLIDGQHERKRLLLAIRQLPEERQQLVVLKFVEQLQNAEIGQIMNRSEGAIKSLYHRTLVQLREALDKLG